MVMYVDLLTRAMDIVSHSEDGSDTSVDEFEHATERLRKAQSDPQLGVEEVVAVEVEYDRALLRLARASGIDAGPESFACPGTAREQLEHELCAHSSVARTVLGRG